MRALHRYIKNYTYRKKDIEFVLFMSRLEKQRSILERSYALICKCVFPSEFLT